MTFVNEENKDRKRMMISALVIEIKYALTG